MRTKGYTLMELLVVVAVILLLAALLLGVVAAVRTSSLRAGCASNLRQLYIALKAYEEDYQKPPPDATLDDTGRIRDAWEILSKYRPAITSILICPADPTEGKRTRGDNSEKPFQTSYFLEYTVPPPLLHPDPRVVELHRWFNTLDPSNPEEVFITCEWHHQDIKERMWAVFSDGRVDWAKARSCSLGNGRRRYYHRPVELTEEQCRMLFAR